ncbi:fibronectin type III-like domain-contianing protein, partial [Thomasclavelia ramosa]
TIRDVVQVYIQNNDSSFAPPNPVLCGFAKSDFVARKKTEVTITIPKAAFQVVNQQGEKIWDSSSSTLFIGMGGVDERSQELTGQPVKKMQIVW